MTREKLFLSKLLYAFIFVVLIPAGLIGWAKATVEIVQLPAVESKPIGFVLLGIGAFLLLWGMLALWIYGKGLPMNAYPPPKLVTQGPYRLFRHPIYWGFGMMMTGYFVTVGSASGFWMVAPLTVLGMVALVIGHESIELKKRFPDRSIRTVLDYPEAKTDTANFRDRLTSVFWVAGYLFISNYLINTMHPQIKALWGSPLEITAAFENNSWPLLSLFFVFGIPFVLKRKDMLREWEFSAFIALSISAFLAFLYPEVGAQYLPTGDTILLAVPIFLLLVSLKSLFSLSAPVKVISSLLVTLVLVIQLQHCRSAILSLSSSAVIFLLSANYLKIWVSLKNTSEKIANSWHEWVFGKIRIINHGFYVGTGAFVGVLLAGILAGKEYALAILLFTIVVNISAALWAQIIEGSAKLKRPFGYYGGIVGIIFGAITVWLIGYNVWVVIGVASVVMPWIQAIGRLRCLINGCCHGRKTDNPLVGIRYFHFRSRVCNISGLKGELLHPTQLYSISWLFVVGILLLTLWVRGCSSPFIFGLYLILTSLGRFVEEAYRGEVQTPVFKGLHLYQWTAIIALVAGILMTTIQVPPVIIHPGFNWESLAIALVSGLFVFFAMGVDFPYSNARFSRLV